MVISDLHYEKRVYRGVDESRAWEWLLSMVDYHRPDLLVSLGDWGEAVNEQEFYLLLRRVRVWSIYGNHENMGVLARMYNVLTDWYEPILLGDGEVREFGGLRFGGINGIIALRRRVRKGVPRKSPEEFVEIARSLRGRIDILLVHDSPKLPLEEYNFIADDERTRAVERAIHEATPRVVFCGHLHVSPYTIYQYPSGTLYVRVDSSQNSKHYILLHPGDKTKLEIWRDGELVEERTLNIVKHQTQH